MKRKPMRRRAQAILDGRQFNLWFEPQFAYYEWDRLCKCELTGSGMSAWLDRLSDKIWNIFIEDEHGVLIADEKNESLDELMKFVFGGDVQYVVDWYGETYTNGTTASKTAQAILDGRQFNLFFEDDYWANGWSACYLTDDIVATVEHIMGNTWWVEIREVAGPYIDDGTLLARVENRSLDAAMKEMFGPDVQYVIEFDKKVYTNGTTASRRSRMAKAAYRKMASVIDPEDIAQSIADGDYGEIRDESDIEQYITYALDDALIYTDDQWDTAKAYLSFPDELMMELYDMLYSDVYSNLQYNYGDNFEELLEDDREAHRNVR